MGLRASTYTSAENFTDYVDGLTLKSRTLRNWLKRKGITKRELSEILGMEKKQFTRRLYSRRKFSQTELSALIHFMGARAAIRVIWFPTIQEKRRIEKYVKEGNMADTYGAGGYNKTPCERKRRQIEEQNRESGEDWDQSEDFEQYIFDTDELPSRRFMRRRNNGQW